MGSGYRRKVPLVLFVEDCSDVRELHAASLEAAGLGVCGAATILEALDVLDAVTPDLVIMDRELPDGDGFELAARLKRDPTTALVPIIAFTASAASSAARDAHAAGMDGFLAKPCATGALVTLVERLLGLGGDTAVRRKVSA